MTYTKNYRLSDILLKNIEAASVFEKYNINYCTNGNNTLDEACGKAEVKPAEVITELNRLNGKYSNDIKSNEWSLDFLCEYIVSNHHTYIRKTFKELLKQLKAILKTKNNSVQNEEIIKDFEKLNRDFEIHMQKEEKLLFPYIKRLVDSEYSETEFEIAPFGLIKKPIAVIKKEHLSAIGKVNSLRNICFEIKKIKTENNIKKTFCKIFKDFEYDFHIHLHLENNLLFPKALLLERKILKKFTDNKINKTNKSNN